MSGTHTLAMGDAPARRFTAQIFNSAVAAAAIGAAWQLGALDELDEHGKLDVGDFAAEHDLDAYSTMAMFQALASVRVVERRESTILVGANFDEVYRAKALFHWLVQGSGELFMKMPSLLQQGNQVRYSRDAWAISYACRDINATFFDPVFWTAMADLDVEVSAVADLGCGSGERLVQLTRRYPRIRGLGLDIAGPALEMAAAASVRAGLSDRLSFAEADVRELAPRPEFDGIDLITCFMMGHDFWPRDACVSTLRRLRQVFPNARRFLLGDTARTVGVPDDEIPVFTLGFEVGHAMMGVYLPTIEEWEGVFDEAGWRCVRRHLIETPTSSFIFELA